MKFIKRFCSATVKGMDWLCGSMLIVMTILAFIGVLARYVFVVSIPWIDEVTRYLMIWMTFLASRFLFPVVRALPYLTLQSCARSQLMTSWSWILWETGKLPCSSL